MRCVGLVAQSTAGEALRHRLWLVVAAAAAAFGGGALGLRALNFGASEPRFLLDAGFGAQWVFGAILAIVATAQLFFAEIERRTVLMVLARPVPRGGFLMGKLGGVLLLLGGFCGLMTGLVVAVLWWRGGGVERADSGLPVLGRWAFLADVAWSGLILWLRLGVLAAMTLLVASYTRSSLFSMTAGFLLLIICQLKHLAQGFLAMMENPLARGLARLYQLLLPDFELLNASDRVVAGEGLSAGLLCTQVLYALTYIGVFGLLAAYCFRHREL